MALDKEKLQEESVIRRFYKIILSWNYVTLLKHKGSAPKLVKVKDKYKDVDDYISTYEPLIFEEAKSQITQGKEDQEEGTTFLLLLHTILTLGEEFFWFCWLQVLIGCLGW